MVATILSGIPGFVMIIGAILILIGIVALVFWFFHRVSKNDPPSYVPYEPWKQVDDLKLNGEEPTVPSELMTGPRFRRNGHWEAALFVFPGYFPNGSALVVALDGAPIRKKEKYVRVS